MPSREDGREGLTELPIEAGIMRNDQIGRFNDGVQLMEVDHLARHHFVCDAGQARDLGRIWSARLLQATINADDIANGAGRIERERHGADLDDLVLAMVEAGRLGIEDHAPQGKSRAYDRRAGTRLELSQGAIAARLLELPRDIVLAQSTLRVALLHRRTSALAGPASSATNKRTASFAQPRGRKRMGHQECSNLRNNVRQIPRIVCNAFDESTPLPLLLLVPCKGVRQGIW